MEVAIAGAGIAGLASALSLARSLPDSHIRVYERSAKISTLGAGIQLGPNAFAALERISPDLSELLKSVAILPECVVMRDFSTGKTLTTVKLGPEIAQAFGQPYGTLHRATLLQALMAACRAQSNIAIEFGVDFQAASLTPARLNASLIVVADGLWSSARQEMLGDVDTRLSAIAFRAFQFFSPGDFFSPEVQVWVGPGVHVVCYPVNAFDSLNTGTVLNVAMFVSGNRMRVLDRTLPKTERVSWATGVSAQEMLAAIPKPNEALRDLLANVVQASAWRVYDQAALPVWHREKTVLVGDAAHAMLPHLAQGAAFALEDAAELGLQMQTNSSVPAVALENFYAARAPRCWRAQNAARRYQKIYHASGLLRFARNSVLSLPLLSPAFGGLSWVYGFK
jgi:2-polyprenyl-6-methoxyphenol hydroxylase-like FAD-dependent oxidoreductase